MNTKTDSTGAQANWFVGASCGGTDDQMLQRLLADLLVQRRQIDGLFGFAPEHVGGVFKELPPPLGVWVGCKAYC